MRGLSAAPDAGDVTFTATNTNSANQNTVNHNVTLAAGQTLKFGTCTVPGSSGTGDTYLRLYNGTTQAASNDDACGTLSYASFTATTAGTYQIRAGCYSTGSCSGTVSYTVQ
ncbi:pre-peptidase C-terminal domain-containing protein [Corallococcus sp. bb12-1]|uniref:pre-peptidase C-terminal domain-containing protein n=1 Tax=Corallococcus sp. bb12-1 TaxID=2996784 RepID=UPI002D1E37E8|nr:pre-peptidase C-terminal domain-containing protein [Corallococcus sp. bb12-1]